MSNTHDADIDPDRAWFNGKRSALGKIARPAVIAARRHALPLVLAATVFFAVTGYGILHKGFCPDDWLHAGGDISAWLSLGRWALHLIFRYLLGGEFHLPLQLTLAFLCFAGVSWMLASQAARDVGWPWVALLIFVAGVNHIYMDAALNFESSVFAYPLSLLLSLLAFWLLVQIVTSTASRFQRVTLFFLAAQILTISLAIYEPFAIFGGILLVIALVRWDRFSLPTVLILFAVSAGAAAVAILLHSLEWSLVLALRGRVPASATFTTLTVAVPYNVLQTLPVLVKRAVTGELLTPPFWLQSLLFAIALVSAAAPMVATIMLRRHSLEHRSIPVTAVLRSAAGGILAVIGLPIVFWFMTIKSYSPARALGYYGFWLAALLCVAVQLLGGGKTSGRQGVALARSLVAMLLSFALLNAFVSTIVWRDRALLSRAELALGTQVIAAVQALPGHTDQPVQLIGSHAFDIFNWGGSLGANVFLEGESRPNFFKYGFGLPWELQSKRSNEVSCPAFPTKGSVFMRGGIAYVCLADHPKVVGISGSR